MIEQEKCIKINEQCNFSDKVKISYLLTWVLGIRRQNKPVSPPPMKALWAPYPVKGQAVSHVMAPWGCLKMSQGQ
jgi:hypothetical protein